ncbi:MAG: hypothetical protein PHV93_04580 [Candidatus Pacebacteria bacterium]|nr:hypothetical protein [Candidatus Paceibacterota bacterium]
MAKKVFQIPAILTRVAFKVDGGLSLGFVTQELSTGEKVLVGEFVNQTGYVMFAANEFEDADVPKENAPDDSKPASQRLRAVIYKLWERKKDGDFEVYYRNQMEKIIQHYKEKLNA